MQVQLDFFRGLVCLSKQLVIMGWCACQIPSIQGPGFILYRISLNWCLHMKHESYWPAQVSIAVVGASIHFGLAHFGLGPFQNSQAGPRPTCDVTQGQEWHAQFANALSRSLTGLSLFLACAFLELPHNHKTHTQGLWLPHETI